MKCKKYFATKYFKDKQLGLLMFGTFFSSTSHTHTTTNFPNHTPTGFVYSLLFLFKSLDLIKVEMSLYLSVAVANKFHVKFRFLVVLFQHWCNFLFVSLLFLIMFDVENRQIEVIDNLLCELELLSSSCSIVSRYLLY